MMAVGRPWSLEAAGWLNKLPHIRHTMTMQHDTTMGSAQNRILDAAEDLIMARGISGFTLDAVAQTAGVSKGGLLYHFSSKDSLVAGLQCRMASRIAETLREAEERSEPSLLAFIRRLRHDHESGGRHFASLLLTREQHDPCQELQSLMTCLARRSSQTGGSKAVLLLLAALGLILSSLARLPCPEPSQTAELFDEMEAIAVKYSI
jgi:AcrR family transcriptional regulator